MIIILIGLLDQETMDLNKRFTPWC